MLLIAPTESRFNLGSSYATANAIATFTREQLAECFRRHAKADWGDLEPSDAAENDLALESEGRLFSKYEFPDGKKLWVITEADRSATTALLPGDY
ncbi:MAG: hypothetical protein KDN05_02885 [Verrucomicrobiae bacterium]|nr:hypothetical protein [Verrucomicrobiae bacterium]